MFFSFVQWNKYFHSVKDELFHSTRFRLVEWNISSFTSWKYLYHCTHKHSLFVYHRLLWFLSLLIALSFLLSTADSVNCLIGLSFSTEWGGHEKAEGIEFFMKNRGVTKIIKRWWGGGIIVKHSGHCRKQYFKIFRATRVGVTILYNILIFSNSRLLYTQFYALRANWILKQALYCTRVWCWQQMVGSETIQLIPFLKNDSVRRCNLKTCPYFGEVDHIMQMICERIHEKFWNAETILFQWNAWKYYYKYRGPKLHKRPGRGGVPSNFSIPRFRLIPFINFKGHNKSYLWRQVQQNWKVI